MIACGNLGCQSCATHVVVDDVCISLVFLPFSIVRASVIVCYVFCVQAAIQWPVLLLEHC